ncbi:MAG: hypothetical protein AB1489_40890, partial [Acidobacteriota bacterium]
MTKHDKYRVVFFNRFIALVALLTLNCLIPPLTLQMQAGQPTKKPISKNGLLEAIRLNGLSTQELIDRVNQRGVSFQLTSQDEAEFRAAGARPELIEAIRTNYRPVSTQPVNNTPTNNVAANNSNTNSRNTSPTYNVPAGPPLSKNEIVTLLQSGLPVARVEQFVEVRGINFVMTPEINREITAAGGSRSLLNIISAKAAKVTPLTVNTGPDYDDLTDQAITELRGNNNLEALRLLRQAIKLDAAQPTAYTLLGLTLLYYNRDILEAEKAMRAAIEHNGGAVFRVYHDHDGFFKQYCQGSFFVTKTGMTYKADDGNHTFAAEDANISEVKLNGFVGSE